MNNGFEVILYAATQVRPVTQILMVLRFLPCLWDAATCKGLKIIML